MELRAPVIKLFSWEEIFSICNRYRKRKKVNSNDIVILLTDEGNELNWFSGFDSENKGNYFIHASIWDLYTGGDPRYPVAYQVVTLLLKHLMFENGQDASKAYHKITRGCMMDFCEEKKQISIKMRTADICGDCQRIISERQIPTPYIKYTTDVMEFIREKILHRNRYRYLEIENALEIRGYMQHIYIPHMGSLQIPLTPLERAVYLLFLKHPEGIRIAEFSDYRHELSEIVHKLSRSDNKEQIERGIAELCSPESNSLSEKMARIRRKFTEALGTTEAQAYIISGPNGEAKTISLPREFITITGNN
jgi:hypothetical protein